MEKNCKECKKPFIISDYDKIFFESRGFSLPKRCFSCRQKRRDHNKIDLKKYIGQYIYRTQASVHGDRSFLGEHSKIKLLGIEEDGTIIFEGKWHWQKDTTMSLSPENNDGYWKVFEEKKSESKQ